MRFLFSILLLLNISATAQVQIDTLKFDFSKEYPSQPVLRFPLVKTGNNNIDRFINADLKDRFTMDQYKDITLDSALKDWSAGNVQYMDFSVTYNLNGIISLQVTTEVCAANCNEWTEYYNYNVVTGRYLALNDIVDTTGKFGDIIRKEKAENYRQNREELKVSLKYPEMDVDSATYEIVNEIYNECDNGIIPQDFVIYPGYIGIYEKCPMPNVIKDMTFLLQLHYKFEDLRKYLKLQL